jgi:hypothetical protein
MDTLKYTTKILLVVVRSHLDFNVASQVSSNKKLETMTSSWGKNISMKNRGMNELKFIN